MYNISMNKNRGMDMEEDKNIELKEIREILKRLEEKENEKTRVHLKMYKNIWRDVALVFLIIIGATIAVTIWQVKINKERYEASEKKIWRNRERILERSLVKSHLFNLYLKLIVISDKKSI